MYRFSPHALVQVQTPAFCNISSTRSVAGLTEKLNNAFRNLGADFVYIHELFTGCILNLLQAVKV